MGASVFAQSVCYLADDRDLVIVANGVFTQEVEFHHTLAAVQLLVEGDVLNA